MKFLPSNPLPRTLLCTVLATCLAVPVFAQPPAEDQVISASERGSRLFNPAASLTDEGGALVLWEDSTAGIQARRIGLGEGLERSTQLVANDLPTSIPFRGPVTLQRDPLVVPLEDGKFLAFWTEERQELYVDIIYYQSEVLSSTVQVRRFNGAGRPVGRQFSLSDGDLGLEGAVQAVRLATGRVAVVWNAHDGQNPLGVYGRLVGSRGVPHATPFRIDEPGEEAGRRPVLAPLADGGFLVAWQQCCDAGGDADVLARRYDADGVAQGAPFAIHEETAGSQVWPALAAGADGELLAAWMGPDGGGDGLEYRIFGQKLAADGSRIGAPLALSSGGGRAHGAPTLAALGDGYALVWTLWRQHFVGGIFGVALDGDGNPHGDAARLSQGTVRFQWELALTTDPAGRVLVAWQGFDGDGKPAINAWTLGPDL